MMSNFKKNTYLLINSLEGGGAEALNISLTSAMHIDSIILLEDAKELNVEEIKTPIWSISKRLKIPGAFKYLITSYFARILKRKIIQDGCTEAVFVVSLLRSLDVAIQLKKIAPPTCSIKIIYWEHANPTYYQHKFGQFSLLKKLYASCDHILLNSMNAREYLTKSLNIPANKSSVFYNFFDFNKIIKLSNISISNEDRNIFNKKTLVYVGRLHPYKGLEFLFEVFNQIALHDEEIQLVIVGKGPLEKFLKNLTHKLNLGNRVFFIGFTKNPYPYIKLADALISPSENEGFGNVLVESLLCGTPVFATDIDNGPREILAPDTLFTQRTIQTEWAKFGILLPSSKLKPSVKEIWTTSILDFFKNANKQLQYQDLPTESFSNFSLTLQANTLQELINKI